MTTLLKEVKSYRAGVTVLEDTERREFWSICESDWNGEYYNATEEDGAGNVIKNGRRTEICEVMTWDEKADAGDLVGYTFGRQTITVRPGKMLDILTAENRTPEDCTPYKAPDGALLAVAKCPDGEEYDWIMYDINSDSLTMRTNPAEVKALAKKYNSDYDCYQGWSDLHILLDACERLNCCKDCQFAQYCCSAQELTDDYVDADGEVYKEA